MMNNEKLLEFIDEELAYMLKRAETYGATTANENADTRSLEWVAGKIHFLQNILALRSATPKEVAASTKPFDHKKTALELFDQETLIAQMLNGASDES